MVAVVFGALVVLSACGSTSSEDGLGVAIGAPLDTEPAANDDVADDGAVARPAENGASSTVPVPELLDFRGAALDGSSVDIAMFAGEDVVFWFWEPH